MRLPRKEFRIRHPDVSLGTIADTPFHIGDQQIEYLKRTHLTIDVVPTRSRLFEDAERAALEAAGPPLRGEQPG